MRAGIWCPLNEAKQETRAGETRYTWTVDLPEGWIETIASVGCTVADGVADPLARCTLAWDGRTTAGLTAAPSGQDGVALGWVGLGSVPPGTHTATLSHPDTAQAPLGLWLTNGPLPFGWPGDLPALAVDEFLYPGKVRPVPVLPSGDIPIEYGRQGLATNLNQQGAMGVADGIVTAVPRALRLRYVDAELHVMVRTDAGLRRVKEVCPNFDFGLLDDWLLAPVARFTYDGVDYAVTFAAVPHEGEAADMVQVVATNTAATARANRVVIVLDAADDLRIENGAVQAAGETIACLGGSAQALRQTRPIGCADLRATTVGDMPKVPFLPSWGAARDPRWDASFHLGRIGWDGMPVRYRLACAPGERFTVYLGVNNTDWSGPAQKPIHAGEKAVILSVDGDPRQVRLDAAASEEPQVARFDAVDHDGDGQIDIASAPDPATPQAVGFLNAIWVFPAGAQVDTDALREGKWNGDARHFVNVGGSAPGGVTDLIMAEDWAYAYAEVSGAAAIPPGQSDAFCVALPVSHRAEQIPYSQARHWREKGEGTPEHAARVRRRHDAARRAVTDPQGALDAVRRYWQAQTASDVVYAVPEAPVRDVVRSSICYFVSHRIPLTDRHTLPVGGGPMYYFDFSERDNGYEIVSIDVLGRHAEAERLLNHYLTDRADWNNPRWTLGQDAQGMWMTREHEEDTQGQVLWALGEHFLLTRDMGWLRRAWPWIRRGLDYIRRMRAQQKATYPDPADPRHGLWISGTDESKSFGKITHSYYFNYWIECGLRFGVLEAEALGETEYARTLRAEYDDFLACLQRSLAQTFWRMDYRRGALANAVEIPDSSNPWGVQESVYPSQSVPVWHPMVAQTVAYCDALAYPRVGGLTLGPRMLWPSATADLAMMHLRRGEGDRAVDMLYAILASCGKVNTWGETIYFASGLTTGEQPYIWANACYVMLLRHMLLHEAGDWLADGNSGPRELWVCAATPRKWLSDAAGIAVQGVPTYFGRVGFASRFDAATGRVATTVDLPADRRPERLVIHFRTPAGRDLRRVTVNGAEHAYFSGEKAIIANPPAHVEVTGWV